MIAMPMGIANKSGTVEFLTNAKARMIPANAPICALYCLRMANISAFPFKLGRATVGSTLTNCKPILFPAGGSKFCADFFVGVSICPRPQYAPRRGLERGHSGPWLCFAQRDCLDVGGALAAPS